MVLIKRLWLVVSLKIEMRATNFYVTGNVTFAASNRLGTERCFSRAVPHLPTLSAD